MLNNEDLRKVYGEPSGRASIKVLTSLEFHSKNFIQNSPFLVLSTFDKNGNVDTSPRGGNQGFVFIKDDNHIIIPDAKGNNRVDSLANIVDTGRIGILFFLPGIDETLRINGSATVSQDHQILELFLDEKRPPKTCIIVRIEEVFLHCAKALMRSNLWNPSHFTKRDDFPTMGRMLKDQLGGDQSIETQEEMVKRYKKDI